MIQVYYNVHIKTSVQQAVTLAFSFCMQHYLWNDDVAKGFVTGISPVHHVCDHRSAYARCQNSLTEGSESEEAATPLTNRVIVQQQKHKKHQEVYICSKQFLCVCEYIEKQPPKNVVFLALLENLKQTQKKDSFK